MAKRTRRSQQYEEDELKLEQVLEPYRDQQRYRQEPVYDEPLYEEQAEDPLYQSVEYQPYPEPGYADYLPEEEFYGEYGDGTEVETRFGMAVHVYDVVSSLIGVFVILVLVAMLLTLVDWLRTDMLHSFVLLQSGIS